MYLGGVSPRLKIDETGIHVPQDHCIFQSQKDTGAFYFSLFPCPFYLAIRIPTEKRGKKET
jgi:hypothetical protein